MHERFYFQLEFIPQEEWNSEDSQYFCYCARVSTINSNDIKLSFSNYVEGYDANGYQNDSHKTI